MRPLNSLRTFIQLLNSLTIRTGTLAVAIGVTSSLGAQPASFQGLGNLDPDAAPPGSLATGVSADGTKVVGFSFMFDRVERLNSGRPFLWTAEGGMVDLGIPGNALPAGGALAISDDGSIVTGTNGFVLDDYYEVRNGSYWTEASSGNPQPHLLAEAMFISDVTADGSMLVGTTRVPDLPWAIMDSAFYYTDGGGIVELGYLPDGVYTAAEAVSADGSVIVGFGDGDGAIAAFMWTEDTGVIFLPGQEPGVPTEAHGISADGSTIVGGYAYRDEGAFRWTADEHFVSLGRLPGSSASYALDASADASVIVGYSWWDLEDEQAFIWNESDGLRSLYEVLTVDYGLDLTGWTLRRATAVSDDGLTICGFGVAPDGLLEAWVATLPGAGGLTIEFAGECPNAGTGTVTWSGATPDGSVALAFAPGEGSTIIPSGPCAGTELGLGRRGIQLVLTGRSDDAGNGMRSGPAPAAACGGFLQLVDIASCAVSNVAMVE